MSEVEYTHFLAVYHRGWALDTNMKRAIIRAKINSYWHPYMLTMPQVDVFKCLEDARIDDNGKLQATTVQRVSGRGDFLTLNSEFN